MTDPDDKDLYKALGDFICLVDPDADVNEAQVDRVPMPKDGFVLMDIIGMRRLATNSHGYSRDGDGGQVGVTTPMECRIQVDFFGDGSFDQCHKFVQKFNDPFCYENMPGWIKPLYTTDPRQVNFNTGEKGFLQRWITEVFLQFNPTVTVPVDIIEDIPVSTILANGNVLI